MRLARRKHLNHLWGVDADALVIIIKWNEDETAEWIEDANPIQLFRGETVPPAPAPDSTRCSLRRVWREHGILESKNGPSVTASTRATRGSQDSPRDRTRGPVFSAAHDVG